MKEETKNIKVNTLKVEKTKEEPEILKKEKKVNKELYWVFGVMILIFAVFFISQSYFKSLKNFEYQGLSFQKVKVGEYPFYYYYYYTKKDSDFGTVTGNVAGPEYHRINLYLYNDPRNNKVPIEGTIDYPGRDLTLFLSVDPRDIKQCKYFSVAITNLALFLTGNQFDVEPATLVEETAEESGLPYRTCENRPSNMVIEIRKGDETKIVKHSDKCYEITANNCEILEAVEKFIVQSLVDAQKISGSQTL